ncbi:YegP family protein [Streptococcus uberis]|uniref:DUF1508 domain-containing protein n=1 Tax=Streptococcus uberis TaxID=1349 RepID=A0A6L6G8W9_STRUB|nr:YegP family protein [Streptococcus uberis]MCK1258068.1 YegP family protein [Streptococcus uberis]MCK1259172.1 YegP family protein [Streptococcus uberis]MTB36490.1 DUF1508 domain-containing protein [Streptococcus uberis]MTB36583.1 DUF1508 domain-containing protein [Streptococcus uberis]MTB54072.1 DUF1508 domain-containing protein [Streptococcus uberis]
MYFVIYKSRDNQYYFVIKSNNNEVVATSETYYYKSSAKATIESIKNNINPSSQVIDVAD